uniref:Uncharacterized protein n=1 Tax=Knipowitschia caucasica TaxID=637954 RepID=A0AAV2LGB9_KNICA
MQPAPGQVWNLESQPLVVSPSDSRGPPLSALRCQPSAVSPPLSGPQPLCPGITSPPSVTADIHEAHHSAALEQTPIMTQGEQNKQHTHSFVERMRM